MSSKKDRSKEGKPAKELKSEEWTQPLLRVLEGHKDLLRITSDFPGVGKLPALGKFPVVIPGIPTIPGGPFACNPIVAVVVVVVCVATAARPGAVTSPELLRAKLLDTLTPTDREVLRNAIVLVQNNPSLTRTTIGIDHMALGDNFLGHLEQVEKALH